MFPLIYTVLFSLHDLRAQRLLFATFKIAPNPFEMLQAVVPAIASYREAQDLPQPLILPGNCLVYHPDGLVRISGLLTGDCLLVL